MQHLRFSLFLCLIFSALVIQAQHLRFSPANPVAGETMTVEYTKAGSPFATVQELHLVAFGIHDDQIQPMDVELSEKAGVYRGTMVVPANAKAVYFSLSSPDSDIKDNNDGKGWGTPVYQSDRKTPVPGQELNMAAIQTMHFYYLKIDRNDKEALRLFSSKFNELKANETLLGVFNNIAARNKDEAAIAQIKAYAQELNAKPKATEDELLLARNLSKALEDEVLTKAIADKLKKKFPKGQMAWLEKSEAFYEGRPTPEQRKAILDQIVAMPLPKMKRSADMLSNMASTVANSCLRANDFAGFEKYSALVTNRLSKAGMYNSIAWKESGESIEGKAGDLERGKKFSAQSLQLIKDVMANPSESEKYTGYSPRELNEIYQNNYAMFSDTYALILYKAGQAEEALKYQQIACENRNFKDPGNNETYCVYLEKVEGPEKTEQMLEKLIAEGYASPAMKTQFKRLFSANNSSEQAAEKYIGLLEKESRMKLKEEIKKKMIDEAAPSFSLLNLKGETVSLDALKGKVVVIDFWATWCGPCISSFPGMQRAQNAHQERSDVVFLFIDTWENGNEKEKNASDFIEKNKYTFNVLMDNDNEVIGKYEVEGIPTKFILDRNGRIRFKSVGYSGNEDALVDEMGFMIELAGEGFETPKGSE